MPHGRSQAVRSIFAPASITTRTEEQRRILIKLAELQWNGIWGDYWRRHEVTDMRMLRGLSPSDFWLRFHSSFRPLEKGKAPSGRTSVEIHSITEGRGLAYVVYQATHGNRASDTDDDLLVLRARRVDGEWRHVALPSVTAKLRRELSAAITRQR